MTPVDIRSAKQVGRLLRCSREAQSVNLNHLSKRCGLSVAQLVHIENGNLFAFEENLQKMMSYSNIYANVLNIDVNTLGQEVAYVPKDINLGTVGSHIPRFLLKSNPKD
jgi:cytoskeletal protein RodZ